MGDPLEKIIRPIVEGQVRSFINDHPEVVEAVNWYKRREDKRTTLINSIAKRIIRDLLCLTTRARLATALVEPSNCESRDDAELELPTGSAGDGVEVLHCPVPSNEVADAR